MDKRNRGSRASDSDYDVAQALDNKCADEQQRVIDFHQFDHDPIKGIASPVRVASAVHPTNAASRLGEDTDDLLSEIGYSSAEIADLRGRALIG